MDDLEQYVVQLDNPISARKSEAGRGCFGTVYQSKLNGAPCVVKKLHDILTGAGGSQYVSEDQWKNIVEKFKAEIKLLSRQRHPNIVQFLGVCGLDGDPRDICLVMEQMDMDLEHFIESNKGEIPLELKVSILTDTVCGVSHLHANGIVHRDLNSGNVLLSSSLHTKVADLGVSRIIDTRTVGRLTTAPGAMHYMPPEALNDKPVYGPKLDCFSFGHLMLYLALELYPHPCEPSMESLFLHRGKPMEGLQFQKRRQWFEKLGPQHPLYQICVICLQDQPEKRWEMSQIREELSKISKTSDLPKLMDLLRENEQQEEDLESFKQKYRNLKECTDDELAELEQERDSLSHKLQILSEKYESCRKEHTEVIEKLKTDLEEQQSLVDLKKRELVNRTTALENQLMEYAGTIQDQGKVIHNMSHHGHGHGEGQYAKLQELYTYATEFTKKQQVEFQEKITYFEKKIERNRNLEEENMVLHDTCDKLTKDIEQHRSQTKQLLRDIESKRKEADKLREKLKNGDQSKSFSERDVLEMETLKQKFEGWKECAERSSEELEVAKIQLKQLEQERDSLSHELQILSESTISDKDAGFTKISKLQKQLKDLQDLRVKQERDLGTLRAEKTQILEHNAELVETSNPEKYTKLKQEVTRLHTQNKELESQLRQAKQNLKLHEEHSLELQKHLEATSNPEILQTIQQKIQKYKQERDTARELVKQVKITSVDSDQQHELVLQTLEGELAEWKMEVAKMKQILAEQKAKKKKYRDNCHQLEGLRKDLLMELQEKEDTIISLQSLLDHHGNKDYEEEMDTVEQGEEWRSYKGDRPMGVSYTETSSSPPRIVSPHSFEIRTLPHRTSHGEDLVDIEPTHSLPRDLTKGYKFETSTIVDTNLGMSPSSHSFSPTPVKSKTPRNSSRKQVIDNISHHGHGHGEGQYAKLQELYTHATEFTKKQQVEFQEKITYFEKKIERNRNLEEENMVLHDTCDKLTKDIEQYRSQTIQLLRDIESKKKEADNLREKLKSGEYSRSFVEFEHLELQEKEVEGGIYSKKLLCRTVGCGFYGIRENDGLCKDCYEKYYMKGLLLPHAIPHGNY